MGRKIKSYSGYQITKDVLSKIKFIDDIKIKEGIVNFSLIEPENIKELCEIHCSKPHNEHIVLGEDWYLMYVVMPNQQLIITDWVAVGNVDNKFVQSMEMFNTLKKILIKYQKYDINTLLRHSTSYSLYKKMLNKGYLEEDIDIVTIEDEKDGLESIKEEIYQNYDSVEEYLQDPNRNKYEEFSLDDYIYHEIWFNVSEKLKKRYKKSRRQ